MLPERSAPGTGVDRHHGFGRAAMLLLSDGSPQTPPATGGPR